MLRPTRRGERANSKPSNRLCTPELPGAGLAEAHLWNQPLRELPEPANHFFIKLVGEVAVGVEKHGAQPLTNERGH